MSWKELICALMVVLGIALFLYGANYYDAVVGWIGVILAVAGIIVYLALLVLRYMTKKEIDQNP